MKNISALSWRFKVAARALLEQSHGDKRLPISVARRLGEEICDKNARCRDCNEFMDARRSHALGPCFAGAAKLVHSRETRHNRLNRTGGSKLLGPAQNPVTRKPGGLKPDFDGVRNLNRPADIFTLSADACSVTKADLKAGVIAFTVTSHAPEVRRAPEQLVRWLNPPSPRRRRRLKRSDFAHRVRRINAVRRDNRLPAWHAKWPQLERRRPCG